MLFNNGRSMYYDGIRVKIVLDKTRSGTKKLTAFDDIVRKLICTDMFLYELGI